MTPGQLRIVPEAGSQLENRGQEMTFHLFLSLVEKQDLGNGKDFEYWTLSRMASILLTNYRLPVLYPRLALCKEKHPRFART